LDEGSLRLGDPGFQGIKLVGGISLSKALLTYYLNKARRLVSQKTLCYRKTTAITVVAGDGDIAFPTDFDFIAVRPGDKSTWTDSADVTYPLTLISRSEYMSLREPSTDSGATPDSIYFDKENAVIYLYPKPSVGGTLTVQARSYAWTQDSATDDETDGIPEEYQELVFAWITSILHPDGQTRQLAKTEFFGGCRAALGEIRKQDGPVGDTVCDVDWGIP
jgi:hypothetical protein